MTATRSCSRNSGVCDGGYQPEALRHYEGVVLHGEFRVVRLSAASSEPPHQGAGGYRS